ncbi:hypothetical protein Ciccas_003567, partial [Cichlidogyrus casuarinus]
GLTTRSPDPDQPVFEEPTAINSVPHWRSEIGVDRPEDKSESIVPKIIIPIIILVFVFICIGVAILWYFKLRKKNDDDKEQKQGFSVIDKAKRILQGNSSSSKEVNVPQTRENGYMLVATKTSSTENGAMHAAEQPQQKQAAYDAPDGMGQHPQMQMNDFGAMQQMRLHNNNNMTSNGHKTATTPANPNMYLMGGRPDPYRNMPPPICGGTNGYCNPRTSGMNSPQVRRFGAAP